MSVSKSLCRIFIVLALLYACKSREAETAAATESVQTPVTITGIQREPMEEYLELNASSTYLLKNLVKANATGYLQSAHILPGQYVKSGQALFSIKTKEAESIGNAVNKLDSTFKFTGTTVIRAGNGGYISQLNHQSGDYIQEGEQLAVISDDRSFVFILELPYELRTYVNVGGRLDVQLPDGEKLPGMVRSLMPLVDAASQTQNVVIQVNPVHTIPENLVAKVRIRKTVRDRAWSLPKASVLSDETQTEFWVMKIIDSTTAVKIQVRKGIEASGRIEILSPLFSSQDRFLLSGNYGLPDTARIKIVQP